MRIIDSIPALPMSQCDQNELVRALNNMSKKRNKVMFLLDNNIMRLFNSVYVDNCPCSCSLLFFQFLITHSIVKAFPKLVSAGILYQKMQCENLYNL